MKKKMSLVLATACALAAFSGCGKKAPESSAEGTSTEKTETAGGSSNSSATDAEVEDDYDFDRNSDETKKKTKKIDDLIDQYFYFDTSGSKEEESYYDGIMKGLDDPYSCYYTAEEYKKIQEDDSGTFTGIGATLTKENDTGYIIVVKPLKDSPAIKAGLKADDIIVEVDDTKLTKDMDLDSVVSIIRGEKGSSVHIKVYRESEKKNYEFDIVRDVIRNETVEYQVLSNDIGYIYVSQFINTTADDFKEAVDDLQRQDVKGLIIDMRGNPGGFVNSSTTMADYLIEDERMAEGAEKAGLLLDTKYKNGSLMDEISCTDGHFYDVPMVVVVDKNTASAAEIFTGILKDYKKATVIGTKTYGKGIVQQYFPLDDGSCIKFTIAKYFLPGGEDIHKEGIEPDKTVEYEMPATGTDAEDIESDNQIQAAMKELTK